jgi:hypothetical protein
MTAGTFWKTAAAVNCESSFCDWHLSAWTNKVNPMSGLIETQQCSVVTVHLGFKIVYLTSHL